MTKASIMVIRGLGVIAGLFILVELIFEATPTWYQSSMISILAITLIIPWRLIKDKVIWWLMYVLMLTTCIHDVSAIIINLEARHRIVHDIVWMLVLLVQLPVVWRIGTARQKESTNSRKVIEI